MYWARRGGLPSGAYSCGVGTETYVESGRIAAKVPNRLPYHAFEFRRKTLVAGRGLLHTFSIERKCGSLIIDDILVLGGGRKPGKERKSDAGKEDFLMIIHIQKQLVDVFSFSHPMEKAVGSRGHIGDIKQSQPVLPLHEAHYHQDDVSDDPDEPVVRDGSSQPIGGHNGHHRGSGVQPSA